VATGQPVTPSLLQKGALRQAIIAPDNSRLVTCNNGGAYEWLLPVPSMRIGSPMDWAEAYAARRLTASGHLVALSADEFRERIGRVAARNARPTKN
jgi:hypothetical protein